MTNLFNPERKSRLDAPERAEWQKPDEVVAALDLQPGDVVADIGAGTGYFTFRIANKVGPSGKVYAVDLQQEMLDTINERVVETGTNHVTPVLSGQIDTTLADATVHLVFIANVTHEYSDLAAGLRECARILKPGGSLVIVDWKDEKTLKGPPLDHRISSAQVVTAALAAEFAEAGSPDFLPNQYILFFTKT
jgi:ubiquinone/menaquinone biosynthesis C-methylase UbiE